MHALMRVKDWSTTRLGPREGWPQSLQTALGIALSSRFPMIIFWGPELCVLYNEAYAPILADKHPAALGRTGLEAWGDHETWSVIGPLLDAVMQRGETTWSRDQMLVMRRRGFVEETYFTWSYSPITDERGGVGGVFTSVIETTETVLAERRLKTLRQLAEHAATAKRADLAFEAAMGILGQRPEDVPFALSYLKEGSTARRVAACGIAPDHPAAPAAITLAAAGERGDEGSAWPLHEVLRTGQPRIVTGLAERLAFAGPPWPEPVDTAIVLPIASADPEEPFGFIVAGTSPRLRFDDAYRSFFALLGSHVASIVSNAVAHDEERRRAEALAELDRAKTAFFGNVSHEFRTPLTLLLGPIEDALQRPRPVLEGEALASVLRNARRLLKLVNTLLEFSRIEAGRVHAAYAATDLAALTAELASNFRAAIERAGLALVVDCPPLPEPVYVDRDMWERIVLNLLSNAFKFTFAGEIRVSLRAEGGACRLEVADTGVGVPKAELPNLFRRFHRIEGTRARTHEGSGIGLALVQELVRLHGGGIAVEAEEGRGTTFTVTIPLGRAHLPADRIGPARNPTPVFTTPEAYLDEALHWLPDPPAPAPAPAHPPDRDAGPSAGPVTGRVLVADDNADMRGYVARLLTEAGHAVETAANGRVALARARQAPPDLMVSDVMMPELDGFGLLEAVRSDPALARTPFVLLSARAGEEARVDGLRAGADEYLVKPFSARELLARVASQLRLRRIADELVESERRHATLLANLPGMAYRCPPDPPWPLEFVSEGVRELTGRPPEDFVARRITWFQIIHPEDCDEVDEEVMRAMTERRAFSLEYRIVHTDGGVRWVLDRGRGVYGSHGELLALEGFVGDITEQKRSEQALEHADRRKDEFLAMLAHELRNPLAPIRNSLTLLASPNAITPSSGSNHPSPSNQARIVEILSRQTDILARLVDDLLDVSRITRNRIELRRQPVDMVAIVERGLDAVAKPLRDQRLHATASLPRRRVAVLGDPVRLEQVVGNLLTNAIKYTDAGGRITVVVEHHGDTVELRVRDTGVGIEPGYLARIFDLFQQAERSLDRSQGGLGIGLTVTKKLVELHGGAIEAHSEGLGRGSEFVVRLPALDEPATAAEPHSAAPSRSDEQRRVLVVDDNADNADTLADLLGVMGHDVRVARDGLQALSLAAAFRPELVLLDIGLPGLDGYEVARRLRREPWAARITLVAVTGYGQATDRERSHEAGFDEHVIKPIQLDVLTRVISRRPPSGASA